MHLQMRQVSASYSPSLLCHLLVYCILSCHHVHFILHVFVSCIRAFSPLSVLHSGAPMSSGVPFYLFLCAGVKRSRIGPRLAKRPWFPTGRPPVKFRAIWTSFDTPTVNRGTEKTSCVLQPNTLPKWPKNPPKPPPSSRSFDHDRVAANRTSFGLS